MSRDARAEKVAEALALHQRHGMGMSHGSPDICRCGERVLPPSGDAEITERRDLAFAAHQAAAVLDALADDAQTTVQRVEALAAEFESEVDWSAGRWDYGDNAAWESAAYRLRAVLNPEPTP